MQERLMAQRKVLSARTKIAKKKMTLICTLLCIVEKKVVKIQVRFSSLHKKML